MSSAPFIPFVRGEEDESICKAHFADAQFVRVCLDRKARIAGLASSAKLWLDVGIDGVGNAFPAGEKDDNWRDYLTKHGDLAPLADPLFIKAPVRSQIESSVVGLLNEAAGHSPSLLSVPQLPYEPGTGHNKINRLLADITADWRKSHPAIRLILPVLLTSQDQLNTKTARNPIVKQITGLASRFGVDAVWAVDTSLEDQLGTGNFEQTRFPGVTAFFEELQAAYSFEVLVAGPHWGLGLVLWSRGLVTHFGVGLGSSYRYHLPGGVLMQSRARIAISALRRWATSTPALRDWLFDSQAKLPAGSPEQAELKALHGKYPHLLDSKIAKRQVARAHREWIDKIVASPTGGRALALYQDLSAAYVTGKMLDDLPDEIGLARRPERVARQLMMNCL